MREKNYIDHTAHERKPKWKSAPWKSERFWSNPIFCTYLLGFPAHGKPRAAPPDITAIPTATLMMGNFPDGGNSLLAAHSSLSPASLVVLPSSDEPSLERIHCSHEPPRRCQLLPSDDCYTPSAWSRKNYSKPGLNPGISLAYTPNSFLPYLREGKTQDPFPQPSSHGFRTPCMSLHSKGAAGSGL